MDIQQVVLWGHKLHSHTHSYIHNAYVIAFKHLGYKTLWLDNNDDISGIDFTGTFFITEGQVHQNMPVRNDCYYVLHNCDMKRYSDLPERQYMYLQVYTHDVVKKHFATPIDVSELSYYKEKDNCLWIPWATDLLPHQIDENIAKLKSGEFKNHNMVSFVGSMTRPWAFIKQFCDNNNIRFFKPSNLSVEDNIRFTQASIVAPAVQDDWQCTNGYIPCRIFKNISYGKMGITNNSAVYTLYNRNIIYDENIDELMRKGLAFESLPFEERVNRLVPLMEMTRDKHTYLNRIQSLFDFFIKIKKING
jgi:hypothetical protein